MTDFTLPDLPDLPDVPDIGDDESDADDTYDGKPTGASAFLRADTGNDSAAAERNHQGSNPYQDLGLSDPHGWPEPRLAPTISDSVLTGSALDTALALTEPGLFKVLPIRHGTKNPGSLVGTGWPDLASNDPEQIRQWFDVQEPPGIAVQIGDHHIVVDVDDTTQLPDWAQEELSHAPQQRTGTHRVHYVLRMPHSHAGTTKPTSGLDMARNAPRITSGPIRRFDGYDKSAGDKKTGHAAVIISAPTAHKEHDTDPDRYYQWTKAGEIPVASQRLADHLAHHGTSNRPHNGARYSKATGPEVDEFAAAHPDNNPTRAAQLLTQFQDTFDHSDSTYDTLKTIVGLAVREIADGNVGANEALEPLLNRYIAWRTHPEYPCNKQTHEEAEHAFVAYLAYVIGQETGHQTAAAETAGQTPPPEPSTDPESCTGTTQTAESAAPAEATAPAPGTPPAATPGAAAAALDAAHAVFRKWLGDHYDTDALDVVLAAAAVERLDGDPLWLQLISGSGNAKTETVQALTGVDAVIVSTISSIGALLSASSKKDTEKGATGGLLRQIEPRGILVIKDFTSVLSQSRETRNEVIAALREVYDGTWVRHVGTGGGKTLTWTGRAAVISAVTTSWDTHHQVIAQMGDRFVIVRMDSTTNRVEAGRQAIRNTGSEAQMRKELADAAQQVIANLDPTAAITDADEQRLTDAANLVTLARTAVEYDYRGDVVDAHAPEMPTRFAKQLGQVMRGALAIGATHDEALALAIRCARDSMPPLRLAVIDDLAAHPRSQVKDVRKRLNKPRATIDRQLQALHMLGIADLDETVAPLTYPDPRTKTEWFYSLAADIDPTAIVVPTN
ncbi:bifunctional DNA primase/polymerase [Gordonia rubripertincta]|uniref:bifunctional DNA primase/polymerase n=1 Tax=Gordonia rubripertincta TaxID=36822 RepID=UPI000B8D6ED6|nr:bifunctional DNA primase/polymerase [Gordonia rubripertincta]ASR04010.1 hypothetical protein GCWB2_16125 [Gordonia rubripertincta]